MNSVERDIDYICKNVDWPETDELSFLVTGATGFIGSLIIKTLLSKHAQIYASFRNEEKAKMLFGRDYIRIIPIIGDIGSVELPNTDYVIHCASATSSRFLKNNPVETINTLYLGTNNVLVNSFKAKGIVYVSSMEVYGNVNGNDKKLKEEGLGYVDITNPRSSYPEGKRACEMLCNAYFYEHNIPVKIARLANTFGPGVNKNDNKFFLQLAKSVINSSDIVLNTEGKSTSNFCYSADAITGIFKILFSGIPGETYNVCNDNETKTIREIADLVAHTISEDRIKVKFDVLPLKESVYAADTTLQMDSGKLREMGWNPKYDMLTGYKNLIDYLVE